MAKRDTFKNRLAKFLVDNNSTKIAELIDQLEVDARNIIQTKGLEDDVRISYIPGEAFFDVRVRTPAGTRVFEVRVTEKI